MPGFDGNAERAVTDGLAVKSLASVFEGAGALRQHPELRGQTAVPCLTGLGMGDADAVTWAEEVRNKVLEQEGLSLWPRG